MTIPQVCKRIGVSDQTFLSVADQVRALKEDDAQRLKALEQENSRLKRIVAEQALDISMLKGLQRGVSRSRRRDAVRYLVGRHPVPERRACNLLWQHRSTQRYLSAPSALEERLVERMNVLAARHPRYGYQRIWALLRGEG